MKYMTERQFREDAIKNPLKYIGKTLQTKEGKIYVIVAIGETGIVALPKKPMGG